MIISRSIRTACAVSFALMSFAAFAGRGDGGNIHGVKPSIASASIVSDGRALLIAGEHFGSVAPQVRIGNTLVAVESHNEREILVQAPSNDQPTTYRLTVTPGGGRAAPSESFFVTVSPNRSTN